MANPKRNTAFVASKRLLRKAIAGLELNAAQSPFFRLPPELRNIIYNLVLGEKTLHVDQYGHARVCPVTSENGASCCFRKHDDSPRYRPSLLLVCRQINTEAALIPFETNTFILDLRTVERFLSNLVAAQRNAIASLDIQDDGSVPGFTAGLSRQLSSLRKLQISVQTCSIYALKLEAELEKLRNGRLESVTVKEQGSWPISIPRDKFDDWAERLKAKLLLADVLGDKSASSKETEGAAATDSARS